MKIWQRYSWPRYLETDSPFDKFEMPSSTASDNPRRPDVPDEPILRWCLPHIWDRCPEVPRVRSRGSSRSDDLRLPKDDQVHLLQIWRQR